MENLEVVVAQVLTIVVTANVIYVDLIRENCMTTT